MNQKGRLSVAVIGAGLIGVDLATKISRSDRLGLELVVGRDESTPGLRRLAKEGLPVAANGIRSLIERDTPFDVVFDATNALAHPEHAKLLSPFSALLVDLTPSQVGRMVIPTVNGLDALSHRNVNMVSCGGQAAIPVLHAVARNHPIEYAEVVTTAAGPSIGRSTRLNLDEYIETTQDAVREFSGIEDVKVMVNLSPARPPVTFRVAISLLGEELSQESVRAAVDSAAQEMRAFVGGYTVTACTVNGGKAFIAVEVDASGDRIPRYAGNLDIINSAALHVAEQYAAVQLSSAYAETS
ncbi:acetaldehyde dehydrogenase [Streptomyces camponoticapitis]|uniref:Acetaldehyde dehydrogenase n=1 Tax=Streptomyces camponoticapitis TaxID=1616125 RepID=A0ABQ2EZU6_9ACTN|nr:acetaldehyde dehydrogenase (acetylating) [Streptomyces camponoticapitis]GGK29933.1 acetaldehyde dehydrogenase [Streptomyces camponoticapitis]